MRMRLTIAYEGTAYSGWQIQEKPNPPPTIQGAVETALFKLFGQKIRVHGSGRTDAGVHALGQTAHCDLPRQPGDLRHSLNCLLPADIRILAATPAPAGFHARLDALAKTYIYNFWPEPAFMPPQLRNFYWSCGKLDLDAMRAALPCFLGSHDFSAFQNAGTPVRSAIRSILEIDLAALPQEPFLPRHLPPLRLSVRANGFLKQMARNIAGFFVWVGQGKLSPSDATLILDAKKRQALPSPTAPPQGLFLARVEYGEAAI